MSMSLRTGVRAAFRAARISRRWNSTSTSPTPKQIEQQRRYVRTGGAIAVIGLTAYLFSQPLHAESGSPRGSKGRPTTASEPGSSHPDRVFGAEGSSKSTDKGNGNGKVAIRDVLGKSSGDEVWVVIKGDVYDMSEFLDDHPGGKDIIVNNRSKDVTPIFNPRHPSDQLDESNLPPNVKHLGVLDVDSASEDEKEELRVKVSKGEEADNERVAKNREELEEKGLGVIVNMEDFEIWAEKVVSPVAWAYYSGAADDEITKRRNREVYEKVTFRPRILRKVEKADCSTTMLGRDIAVPIYIAPAAQAKLGHPDGEVNLVKGAHNTGIIQVISSNASCSVDEICASRAPSQPLVFQLYVPSDRKIAADRINKVNSQNLDAIFLTGDAPVGGKREKDMRLAVDQVKSDKGSESRGVSEAMFSGMDPNLTWEDIKWIQSHTDKPIIVKGIQTVEDALMAWESGAHGIAISNHGGRQLDTAPATLDVLLEIRKHAPQLVRPQFRGSPGLQPASLENFHSLTPPDQEKPGIVKSKDGKPFEIFIDGGIHRGTDVVKALCLGASAVGLGRGFLYAQSVGGVEGVEHAVGILQQEIQLAMRLLGANTIDELRPSMVEIKE